MLIIEWLILMACQPLMNVFCKEVIELLSLYVHIHILCEVSYFGTLTSTITPGQDGPGSNCNEGVLYTPQISKWNSMSYLGHPLFIGEGFCLMAQDLNASLNVNNRSQQNGTKCILSRVMQPLFERYENTK